MIKFIEKRGQKRKLNKKIFVLYHNDCSDGFTSAWVAWKKFGNKADYVGIDPSSKPIDGLKGKEVYMLDVIYPIQYLKKIIKENKKVIAVDHHLSNKKSFDLVGNGLFDLNHSGAVLAWKYFNAKTKIPKLIKHVEDVDLWKFKLPKTKEIFSYLDTIEFSFGNWDKVSKNLDNKKTHNQYVQKGALILNYQDILINRIIEGQAELVNFFGHKVYAVNSPLFNSQIANPLINKRSPIGIVWSQSKDGVVHVSLRSDGSVDVSKLAAKFKGGGHKKAAGFYVKGYSNLPWKKIK